MTQTISIKPLTAQDKTSWLEKWNSYLNFYETNVPDEVTEYTWNNILEAKQVQGFGAFIDNKLVGIVHIVIHPNTWNTTQCCYLEDLFVSESVRGQGVGKALIQHIYEVARQQNFNRVYWVTDKGNTTAQKLYDSVATQTGMIQYRFNPA